MTPEQQKTFDRAIVAAREKYGSLDSPDFSFVQQALDEQSGDDLIREFEKCFRVEDYTDTNDDVAFFVGLTSRKSGRRWGLALSMVGPFATLLRVGKEGGVETVVTRSERPIDADEERLLNICEEKGFQLLDKKVLSQPVRARLFNTQPERVKLYQVLFSDVDLLPWERWDDSVVRRC